MWLSYPVQHHVTWPTTWFKSTGITVREPPMQGHAKAVLVWRFWDGVKGNRKPPAVSEQQTGSEWLDTDEAWKRSTWLHWEEAAGARLATASAYYRRYTHDNRMITNAINITHSICPCSDAASVCISTSLMTFDPCTPKLFWNPDMNEHFPEILNL